jgi:hypothetical protein
MRSSIGLTCFTAMFFASSLAQAATIEPVYGNLSVNQGQGFQPVNGRIEANVGDAVMVGPDGTATVVYSDGCQVNVQPGAVVSIAPLSPCASGSFAAASPDPNQPFWGSQFGNGFNVGTLAVIGLGTAAVVGAAVAAGAGTGASGSNQPTSP